MGTRRFDRPSFLSDNFEEPELQYFYMYKECHCPELKLAEIKKAFTVKQSSVINGLKVVTSFFE